MTLRGKIAVIAVTLAAAACSSDSVPATSTLITGATVFDGSGADGKRVSVRIDGDRIVAVGDLSPLRSEAVVDARGLVLAPGFIDTHSHHDSNLDEYRHMPGALSQGVTTIVRGVDGFSDIDNESKFLPQSEFNDLFIANPAAVNIASYSPHNSIRHKVMGDDYRREATDLELEAMARLVDADLQAGAIGLSTGLEYEPGMYAPTEEVIRLAGAAARFGGTYSTHLRDEDDGLMEAIDEAIRIGHEAGIPVLISHIKIADRALWGTSDEVLAKLDAARRDNIDIRVDIYPYEHWASNLAILFPDRDYSDRDAVTFTFEHTATADDIVLIDYPPNPDFEGLTVAEIAGRTEQELETTLMQLARAADEHRRETGRAGSRIIARGMNEEDIGVFATWPFANFCSDGGHTIAHPRSFGAFPRVFRQLVSELELLTLADAIYKMTGLPASTLGLKSRGRIEPGMHADLVLFDPETITDRATMSEPTTLSEGIQKVWVNGMLAFANGSTTDRHAGRIVTLTN